jgi:hypothetical protein
MCIFQVDAYPGGAIMIRPGKPGNGDESRLRRIVRDEMVKAFPEVRV